MERDPSAKARGRAEAWDHAAAVNVAAGAAEEVKAGDGEAAVVAVAVAALAKAQAPWRATIRPVQQAQKNQTHKRKECQASQLETGLEQIRNRIEELTKTEVK
jgi:hypothetical protein